MYYVRKMSLFVNKSKYILQFFNNIIMITKYLNKGNEYDIEQKIYFVNIAVC